MNINDILVDSLTKVNPDSSISVVYEDSLYELTLDSIFRLPDTTVMRTVKLDSISLGTRTVTYKLSLGQIAAQADPLTQSLIYSAHGTNTIIPAFGPVESAPFNINAQSLFETVTLISGFMDLKIENELPTDIKDVVFRLSNKSDTNYVIVQDTFALIPAYSSVTKTISLAGKTIEGLLVGRIVSMYIVGSNGAAVPVDTSKGLITTMTVHSLKPSTATAKFPAQDIVNKDEQLPFNIPQSELTFATIKKGVLKVEAYSTLQDTVRFTYKIPSATLNGDTFKVTNTMPPAAPGNVSKLLKFYDFTGYDLDLTGKNRDTINAIHQILVGRIDSTGQIKTITLQDSFYFYVGFIGLYPSYARGYMGQDSADIGPSSIPIDLFNRITGGTLNLEDVKMSLTVENGMGIEGRADIKYLESVNSKKGTKIPLSGSGVTSINIARGIENAKGSVPPATAVISSRILDNTNSNSKALIENFPDSLNYYMRVHVNPNGNPFAPARNDFVYDVSTLKAKLSIELPLSMIASQLTLVDTADFAIGAVDVSSIKDGVFTLIADNGFPFDAAVQMYMMDSQDKVYDSLFIPANAIAAATLDVNQKVSVKKRTKLLIPVSHEKIDRILDTKKMKIVVSFTTLPQSKYVKVYSGYSIDFKLIADFNYLVK
jgi:hypothetical protein